MTSIYCDEAGNTGQHLLDAEQPIFVLASNDFSSAEARALLAHAASPQSAEPKFAALRRTAAGQQRLQVLLSDPRLNKTRVAVFVLHKEFMVYTKLVDLIMETLMHKGGYDLYKEGANLGTANLLFCCTRSLCGEQPTHDMLSAFVELMRFRTTTAAERFFEAGTILGNRCKDSEFAKILSPFYSRALFPQWFPSVDALTMDPAIPALFRHIVEWGRRKTDRFRVLHDNSKPVLASESTFRLMMAAAREPSSRIGYDRRQFDFPLRAISLDQADSRQHPQIQIADICAGAIAYLLKQNLSGEPDELSRSIQQLGCFDWVIDAVYPTTDVTPAQLGTDIGGGRNPIEPFVERLNQSTSR